MAFGIVLLMQLHTDDQILQSFPTSFPICEQANENGPSYFWLYIMLNKNTQGAKKGEANQKQQLSSR